MTDTSQRLDQLRQGIDALDSQLVELLAKRAALTTEVGKIKAESGVPVYVPEREKSLIASRREQAEHAGVSPELVEDLLRRIMRESYHTQNNRYRCVNPDVGNIVVIGGGGALGSVFVSLFSKSGYSVASVEKTDWDNGLAQKRLSQADVVVVAVPINVTEQVISTLTMLKPDCILADVTSIKKRPLEAMLATHAGPVIGLHPMFGPDAPGMIKQVVVVTEGRDTQKCQWLMDQMTTWGATLHKSGATEHDEAMAYIQVMRHFNTFVYGAHLSRENPDLSVLKTFSSPIYRLELAMVGRLFAQPPELYGDIIFNNPENFELLKRFHARFGEALSLLDKNDKSEFVKQFNTIAQWFGPYARKSLKDSKKLLLKADDDKM